MLLDHILPMFLFNQQIKDLKSNNNRRKLELLNNLRKKHIMGLLKKFMFLQLVMMILLGFIYLKIMISELV